MLSFTTKHTTGTGCIHCGRRIEVDHQGPHDERCITSSSPCAEQFLARVASHIFNDCPLTVA
jgi:hypothetical protein